MSNEVLDITMDYEKFVTGINKAYYEHRNTGCVKQGTHDDVKGAFVSLCAKLDNISLNFATVFLVGDIIQRLGDYTRITGYTFNELEVILKYLIKKNG